MTVAEINVWHKARGWSGIGYHRVIGLNGERWAGRPIEAIGAHCEGHNARTIGVVYVGGLTKDAREAKDTRTPVQKEALLAELRDLLNRFPTIGKISGHRDYAAKACPCFDAYAEYKPLTAPRSPVPATRDPMLLVGSFGPAVVDWRRALAHFRQLIGVRGDIGLTSEAFDQQLELATRWFQGYRRILQDGKVGPQTRLEMTRALVGAPPFEAL